MAAQSEQFSIYVIEGPKEWATDVINFLKINLKVSVLCACSSFSIGSRVVALSMHSLCYEAFCPPAAHSAVLLVLDLSSDKLVYNKAERTIVLPFNSIISSSGIPRFFVDFERAWENAWTNPPLLLADRQTRAQKFLQLIEEERKRYEKQTSSFAATLRGKSQPNYSNPQPISNMPEVSSPPSRRSLQSVPTPKPPPVLGIVFHQASQPEASKAQLWCDQLRAMSPASYKTQIRLFTEAEAVAAKPMAVVVMVLTASVRYSATSSLKELIGELKKVTEVVEVVALYQNATTGPIVGWNTTNHGEPDTLIDFTPMNWYCSMDNGFVGSSDKQQAALSKVRSDWLRLLESIERR